VLPQACYQMMQRGRLTRRILLCRFKCRNDVKKSCYGCGEENGSMAHCAATQADNLGVKATQARPPGWRERAAFARLVGATKSGGCYNLQGSGGAARRGLIVESVFRSSFLRAVGFLLFLAGIVIPP
jgi:hypothetical protein